MSLFVVIRGQCDTCGFARNLYVNEMTRKEVLCDHADQGCPGKMFVVWTGPKYKMPQELIDAYDNGPHNAGQERPEREGAAVADQALMNATSTTRWYGDESRGLSRKSCVGRRRATTLTPGVDGLCASWMRADTHLPFSNVGRWRWSPWRVIPDTIEDLDQYKVRHHDRPILISVRGSEVWPETEFKKFEGIPAGIRALQGVVSIDSNMGSFRADASKAAESRRLTTNPSDRRGPRRRRTTHVELADGETFHLKIVLPDGTKQEIELSHDEKESISDHVVDMCKEYELPNDNFVLYYTHNGDGYVIGTWSALRDIPINTWVQLKSATEVASECMNDDNLSNRPLHTLSQLLRFIEEEHCLAEELISGNALKRLLDYMEQASEETIELSLLCIFELLQYEAGLEWLKRRWDTLGVAMFVHIFDQLFLADDVKLEQHFPYVAMALCMHLHLVANLMRPPRLELSKPTSLVEAAHAAAKQDDSAAYKRMLSFVGGDPEAFSTQASWLIFGMLLRSEFSSTVEEDVKTICTSEESALVGQFFPLLKTGYSSSEENIYEEVLVSKLSECCARMNDSEQSLEVQALKRENLRLTKEVFESYEIAERLKAELRNRQKVMEKLAPFVNVADSPAVTESVRDIMKNGWSTAEWSQGYSLLHYVCEFSKNPAVVDLVAALCTEIVSGSGGSSLEDPDVDGNRAGDYAKDNKEPKILEIMQEYQKEVQSLRTDVETVPYASPKDGPSAALAQAKASTFSDTALGGGKSPSGSSMTQSFTAPSPLARSSTSSSTIDVFGGFSDELLLKYWSSIVGGQSKVVIAEMQRSTTTGGLGFSEEKAKAATSRLELLAKNVPQNSPTAAAPKGKGKDTSTESTKGKGKGAPPAPEPAKEASHVSGKGKGKKGGPPPPPKKAIKAPAVQPTRPEIEPVEQMKPCRLEWGRYIFGTSPLTVDSKDVDCVWESVKEQYPVLVDEFVIKNEALVEELVTRYSKTTSTYEAGASVMDRVMPKKKKDIQVVTGDSRMPMELGIRKFKEAGLGTQDIAKAILSKSSAIDEQMMKDIIFMSRDLENNCMQIEAMQAAESDVPLAELERYMMALRPISALEQRLECRAFLLELPGELEFCEKNCAKLKAALNCVRNSTTLPELLAIALSITNYVNGADDKLGRADGFHIDALGEGGSLSLVKDSAGRDLRHLILKYFIAKDPNAVNALLEEMSPLLQNMKRVVHKLPPPADTWAVDKEVSLSTDLFALQAKQLDASFKKTLLTLKAGQKLVADRTDPLHTDMVVAFDTYKAQVESIASEADRLEETFKDLVQWFLAEKTKLLIPPPEPDKPVLTSQDTTFELFCRVWDDFFMPTSLLLGKDEKSMKEQIVPRFSKVGAAVTVDDLQYLWNLPKAKPIKPKSPLANKRRARIKKLDNSSSKQVSTKDLENPNSTAASKAAWGAARRSLQDGKIKKMAEPEHTRMAGTKSKFKPMWELAIGKMKEEKAKEGPTSSSTN